MDTAISAELKAAKASELLKMVNHRVLYCNLKKKLTCIQYPKYIESSEKTEDGQVYPREWKPKDGRQQYSFI